MKKRIISFLLALVLLLGMLPGAAFAQAAELGDVQRISGMTRIETALGIADQLKTALAVEKFNAVVVASAQNFPDALVGSYLAIAEGAPILLTQPSAQAAVVDYIEENLEEGGKVFILGGSASVSESMETALADLGIATERLAGKNRIETNLEILEKVGVTADQEILICTSAGFPDSLSVAATGLPILLVGKNLTQEQKSFLETTSGYFTIVGGNASVSSEVEAELQTLGTVTRLGGATRLETSVNVANQYFADAESVILAYAWNFPDGLCGGPLAAATNAALVMTGNDNYTAADDFVVNVSSGIVLGGQGLISDETVRDIFDLGEDAGAQYYTVTFDSNGGSAVASQTVMAGELAVQPEDPQLEGYRLLAWYCDAELSVVYDFATPVMNNLTLYAAWEEISTEVDSFLDQEEPDVEIYSFDRDVYAIPVNEEATVTFEAEIFAESALSEGEVLLYQDGEAFGIMYDDGTNGDITAEDGIYTYQTVLSGDTECTKSYQVKVRTVSSEVRTIGFYVPMTEEELTGMQQVDAALAQLTASEDYLALTTEEKAEQVVALLTQLAEEGLVVADSIEYDELDQAVYYEYSTGALGVVELERNEEWNSGASGDKSLDTDGANPADITGRVSGQSVQLSSSGPDNERNVLVLNGFEDTTYRRDYYSALETEWDEIGLNTTVDVDVTVADMMNLANGDWDVVIFAMHGNKYRVVRGEDKRPVLCINEEATEATDDAYDYFLTQTHSVIKSGSSYWITPQFFTDIYGASAFSGMMFYSETCMFYGCDCQTTTPDYTLANAITGRSAQVVVGYHNSVGASYSRNVMKVVVEESFNGASVNTALNTATAEYGADDGRNEPSRHKYTSYPLVAGNGSFVLRADGRVSGTVKDASNGNTISNVLIRAYNADNEKVAEARSDSSGAYNLSLSAGTYTLKFSAGTYKTSKMQIVVNSEGTTYVESFLMTSNTFVAGSINGTITNSVTDLPVPGVTVKLRRSWNNKTGTVLSSTQTGTSGYFEFNDLSAGAYTLEYYKSGFITGYKNVVVTNLTGTTQNAVISPVASDGVYRIVLTWGENPADLDSHVQGTLSDGYSFHTYYSNKSDYDGDLEVCNLDVDDVTSYGPETITLNTTIAEPYYYYVYHYSGSGSISTSGAQVKVYKGNDLVNTYFAPEDQGTGRYWNVFAVVNGTIQTENTITSTANVSYANASYGSLKLDQTSTVSSETYLGKSDYEDFLFMMDSDSVIPGLADNYIPQGITISANTGLTYVSSYYKDPDDTSKKKPSVITVLEGGVLVAEYYLYNGDNSAMTGHVGGVAVTDDFLYVSWNRDSDSKFQIAAIPLATLTDSGSQNVKLTRSYNVPISPSFMSYYDGYLWVGNFYIPNNDDYDLCETMDYTTWGCGTYIMGYNLDGSGFDNTGTNGYSIPDVVMVATEKVQGMVYDPESGTVVLSRSWSRNALLGTAELNFYDVDLSEATDTTVTVAGHSMGAYVLSADRFTKTVKSIPMNEGIALDRFGYLWAVYESGANYYSNADYPTDRLWRSVTPVT